MLLLIVLEGIKRSFTWLRWSTIVEHTIDCTRAAYYRRVVMEDDRLYLALPLRRLYIAAAPIIPIITRLLAIHSPLSLSCWHRAAWRLLRKAAELVQPVQVMPTEAEFQALVDELYA